MNAVNESMRGVNFLDPVFATECDADWFSMWSFWTLWIHTARNVALRAGVAQ